MTSRLRPVTVAALLAALVLPTHAATVLFTQNWETPNGFVNDGGDLNIFRTVNQNYANQPAGFTYWQPFTTETLLVGGTQAFGVGFKDPENVAGKYVIGMLSSFQDDRLGMAFNVGANKFLNFKLDVSSIDLDRFSGPFVAAGGEAPVFRFKLFDNPGGIAGRPSGSALSFADAAGVKGPNKFTFDWTNAVVALDATGNTNGNVLLEIDLLSGGYAAIDNFVIAAADKPGDVGEVPAIPEPGTWALMLGGLGAIAALHRRRQRR
jgi:PEP-CTERM motif